MSDTVEEKIKNYRTAPFDARFPNTNQTRNCFQNYLGEDVDRDVAISPRKTLKSHGNKDSTTNSEIPLPVNRRTETVY